MVVLWLGLCALIAKGPGSISGWGTNMPQGHNVRGKKVDGYWNFLDFKLRAILSPFLFHVGFLLLLVLLFFCIYYIFPNFS